MTITYQQQYDLSGAVARSEILNLNARHNRSYTEGDLSGWIATFRHSGAVFVSDGECFSDLHAAFEGGKGRRLVTVDNDISVDGISATQRCVALLYEGLELLASGAFRDELVYERGSWYFSTRQLDWDLVDFYVTRL